MAIYAIADLHLAFGNNKPMDIFKGWQDYTQRIEKNWRAVIEQTDTVVLPGDISWAMKLEDCKEDFAFIHALPGQKVILKGNHDYWWSTMKKMENYIQTQGFDSLHFIQNNCYMADGVAICGTRSWLFDVDEPHDEKVMNREVGRLTASLTAAQDAEKIAFLHYPPIYPNAQAAEIIKVLKTFQVKECYYGHLHSGSIAYAIQGEVEGIVYKLISADGLQFCPYKIR